MRSVIAALVLLACSPLPVVSQQPLDPATKQDVEKFLELIDFRGQMHSLWNTMEAPTAEAGGAAYKQANPQASAADVEKAKNAAGQSFQAFVNYLNIQEFIDAAVPIYQRHFTHSDMLAINEFAASSPGQKLLRSTPVIAEEDKQAFASVVQKRLAEYQLQKRIADNLLAQNAIRAEAKAGGASQPGDTSKNAAPAADGAAERSRVSPEISQGFLLSQVEPVYPPLARQARIQGAVVLNAQIGDDGTVESLNLVSGHPMLVQSAIDAVKQWRYKPFLVNGVPVAVLTQITVNFQLQ